MRRPITAACAQIEPVVLVATAGYRYNGAPVDCRPRLAEIRAGLPSVRATVVVPDRSRTPDEAGAPNVGLVDL